MERGFVDVLAVDISARAKMRAEGVLRRLWNVERRDGRTDMLLAACLGVSPSLICLSPSLEVLKWESMSMFLFSRDVW